MIISGVREAKELTSHADKHVGQAQGQGTTYDYNRNGLIWKTYLEFKAYRKVIFYTYTNENSKEITEIVPSSFPIPDQAVKVKFVNRYGDNSSRYEWVDELGNPMYAEIIWVPRRYEITRWGNDTYTDMREVPNQPINIR